MKSVVVMAVVAMMACGTLWADEQKDDLPVEITPDLSSLHVNHKGQKVKVARIQDTTNRQTADYTETPRECPPFCIHPKALSMIIQDNFVLLKKMHKTVQSVETVGDY
ncbi:MAG: hypothetical protein DSZ05_04930 [Sulfurospirillum sp.]|nr:MAG: hypothetical protein DSZ05_04930 [Sulfurospirillum sp.]